MITCTDNLKKRIQRERDSRNAPDLLLRIEVISGGCAGFQYNLTWVLPVAVTPDDTIYDHVVVIDDVSAPLFPQATIDFVQSLMGEDFKITNPLATSGCGCGNSFAV